MKKYKIFLRILSCIFLLGFAFSSVVEAKNPPPPRHGGGAKQKRAKSPLKRKKEAGVVRKSRASTVKKQRRSRAAVVRKKRVPAKQRTLRAKRGQQHRTLAAKKKGRGKTSALPVKKVQPTPNPPPQPQGYFALLNSQVKQNATLGGMKHLLDEKLYGQGQTVAVIDYAGTWREIQNVINSKQGSLPPEMRENYKRNFLPPTAGPGFSPDATSNWIRAATGHSPYHGSHVASVVLDYAPQAKVLPVSVYCSPQSEVQSYDLADALLVLSLKQEVTVINTGGYVKPTYDWRIDYYRDGTPTPAKKLKDAFTVVARAGKAIVMAAGNEGREFPSTVEGDQNKTWEWSGYFTYLLNNLDLETQQSIIIAGNLDPDTRAPRASSNRPGSMAQAQERFLFAPAGKIQISYSGEVEDGGTSLAAPYICAAIANLSSKPGVTPKMAVKALLDSAERRPDVRTYGRGLIRADRASDLLDTWIK